MTFLPKMTGRIIIHPNLGIVCA